MSVTEVVMCSNDEGHEEGVPAVWDVTFPSGRWHPCTACWECFDILLDNLREEPEPVVLVPLNPVGKGSAATGESRG